MIPGKYDIELYDGDSYFGPLFALPDLTPHGGPQTLALATVRAQIRERAEAAGFWSFRVEVVDAALRQVRLHLTAAETLAVPARGVWDLEVVQGGFTGTVLAGSVKKKPGVTR